MSKGPGAPGFKMLLSRPMCMAFVAAATVFSVVGASATAAAATPIPIDADTARPTLQRVSLVLDDVDLELHTPFLPGVFAVARPGNASQVAVATSWDPFRELSITAVPFGTTPGTELLPFAAPGGSETYRAALRELRLEQGAELLAGPSATLFGEPIDGAASLVFLNLDSEILEPTLIVEWVAEAGERLWIIRVSQELPDGTSSHDSMKRLFDPLAALGLDAADPDVPTTVFDVLYSGQAGADEVMSRSTVANLPYPSWWNGNCDTNYYYSKSGIYAYPLGGSYQGMPACGPRPYYGEGPDVVVYFYSGAWGEYEWECVELSMRYLYLAYGIGPYSANGSQVVWNYSGSALTKISNGTANAAPQAGDVLSYGSTSTWGHTSVVTASSVNSSGNGSITVLEQNASSTGVATLSVSGWTVSNSVSGWLHKSGSTSTEIIVDDTSSSFVKYGPSSYWYQASIGYNGHMWWTYVNGSTKSNYARWKPKVSASGNYQVYVFIPSNYATSQAAKYKIYHKGATNYYTVNQNSYYDQWVSIGTYSFSTATTQYIELSDATGEASSTSRMLGFDAIKLVKR